jgi:hypothetical protein
MGQSFLYTFVYIHSIISVDVTRRPINTSARAKSASVALLLIPEMYFVNMVVVLIGFVVQR